MLSNAMQCGCRKTLNIFVKLAEVVCSMRWYGAAFPVPFSVWICLDIVNLQFTVPYRVGSYFWSVWSHI